MTSEYISAYTAMHPPQAEKTNRGEATPVRPEGTVGSGDRTVYFVIQQARHYFYLARDHRFWSGRPHGMAMPAAAF